MPSSQSANIPANQRRTSASYSRASLFTPTPTKATYGKPLMSALFFATGMLLMIFLVHLA